MAVTRPERALARLEAEHGTVPVGEARFEVPAVEFERLSKAAAGGYLGGARAVPRRGGAVLLVRTVDAPDEWAAPGGEREPGESHVETARRATRAETGLDVSPGPLLAAKRYTFVHAAEPTERVTGLWTWFGATDEGGRPAPASGSVLAAAWFTELPDGVDDDAAAEIASWVAAAREGDAGP